MVNINAYIERQLSFVHSLHRTPPRCSLAISLQSGSKVCLLLPLSFAYIDHLEAMSIVERVKHWYFVYELRTSLYMMEPWEKGLFSK